MWNPRISGIKGIVIFFISPTLALCESALAISTFKEKRIHFLVDKGRKKVSMFIVYFEYQCHCQSLFISPIIAFCKSALTISESSIIAEKDNFKEEEFTVLVVRLQRRWAWSYDISRINAIVNCFSYLQLEFLQICMDYPRIINNSRDTQLLIGGNHLANV